MQLKSSFAIVCILCVIARNTSVFCQINTFNCSPQYFTNETRPENKLSVINHKIRPSSLTVQIGARTTAAFNCSRLRFLEKNNNRTPYQIKGILGWRSV